MRKRRDRDIDRNRDRDTETVSLSLSLYLSFSLNHFLYLFLCLCVLPFLLLSFLENHVGSKLTGSSLVVPYKLTSTLVVVPSGYYY